MNQTKAKYALGRVGGIAEQRKATLRVGLTKPAKVLSPEERVRLLRSGKIKLRADIERINDYTDVTDAFDFSKHEWEKTLDESYVELASQIDAEADAIRDQIMLGDEETALTMITAFAAGS